MKIEVIIRHIFGDTKRHLVHKLVKHGDLYTAHYSTVKAGFHVPRKAVIDNVTASIEVTK